MTPHMGEMGRLTGKKVSELQKDRIAAARELAAETGAVCVLKDACTVTAAPDGNTWISLAGNPGMATAGSGDVLTGILAGVLAMFLNKRTELPDTGRQAALGVLLHGMAGDLAAKEKGTAGMKAGDIVMTSSVSAQKASQDMYVVETEDKDGNRQKQTIDGALLAGDTTIQYIARVTTSSGESYDVVLSSIKLRDKTIEDVLNEQGASILQSASTTNSADKDSNVEGGE